jgi:ribose/xylose/arabinose/galactoside ABC-type transport system permease subunit
MLEGRPAVNTSALRGFFQRFGLLISFLLLCIALSFLSDRFLTVGNWTNILRQSTINLIIAIGMTYVILTAGIDLSVGAVLALATVVTADLLQRGIPILPTVIVGLTLGGALGLASGVLISRVKVPPFVATLGMMTVARGLALTYTQGRPITGLPDAFRTIGTGYLGPIPMPIIVAGVAFLAGYILLTRTRMGMNIYALGNNPVAAHYAGIATTNYTTFVYVLAGALAALAGMILVARLDSAQPTAGLSYEFDAIAAVVVGGTSFAGGEGSLVGTLLGVLVISVLNNGLNLLNVSSFYQPVVTGVVIALALLLYKAVR